MYQWTKVIFLLITISSLLGGCSNNPEQVEVTQVVEADVPANEPAPAPNPTEILVEADATKRIEAVPATEPVSMPDLTATSLQAEVTQVAETVVSTSETTGFALPERSGPRTQTTGSVPHIQINVEPVTAVNDELYRLAFSLPSVEDTPTIVSLPGAKGMWLSEGMAVARPKAIVNGREFAHIHPDGSLHAPLPFDRALEVAEKGWGERHPWAEEREGWEGFVMLYTPQSMEELDITFQLIVESYNHVTGQTVQASDFK